MPELIVHPASAQQLARYRNQPTHALLLVAPAGSGKLSIAHQLAADLLGTTFEQSFEHPYIMQLSAASGLNIEAVREIEQFMKLRVPATDQREINRVVIIDGSDQLTDEAQNALLKTLEEPPEDSVLILTAANRLQLLPTIRSRVQSLQLQAPTAEQLQAYFQSQGYTQPAISQALAISGGLAGLTAALLADQQHPLLPAVDTARRILGATTFDRLAMVDELSKQKDLAASTLQLLQHMAQLQLRRAQGNASRQWQQVLTASYDASIALSQSGQPKLILTNLMLSL